MKKKPFFLLVGICAVIVTIFATPKAHAAFALIATSTAYGGADGATSTAINTTGANLIVVIAGWNSHAPNTMTVTDSASNTWTGLTVYNSNSLYQQIFYSLNPTVGASKTFHISASQTFPNISVEAFSGAAATNVFDVQNGSSTSGNSSSYATGNISPSRNKELIISGLTTYQTGITVDSGLIATGTTLNYNGTAVGSGMAYKIQSTAATISPTWSTSGGSNQMVVAVASFGSNDNYSYYRTITVTSTNTIASGTQINFPMLVSSTLTSWEASTTGAGARIQNLCTGPVGTSTVQEPCDLIYVNSVPTTDSSTFSLVTTSTWNCGASLNFETENYVSSTGALIDWVSVPSLSAGSVIYACYGNVGVNTDQSNPSSTWDSNYKGVWHLGSGNNSLFGADSTSNGNNFKNTNTATTTGQISGGALFNGTSSFMDATNTASLQNATFTYELWAKPSALPANSTFISQANGGPTFRTNNSGGINTGLLFSNECTNDLLSAGLGSVSTSSWSSLVLSVANTNATNSIIYVNGNATSVNPIASQGFSWDTFRLGEGHCYTQFYTGIMDEVRESNIQRSSGWIKTEYSNQSSPSTFYAIGAETVPTFINLPILILKNALIRFRNILIRIL